MELKKVSAIFSNSLLKEFYPFIGFGLSWLFFNKFYFKILEFTIIPLFKQFDGNFVAWILICIGISVYYVFKIFKEFKQYNIISLSFITVGIIYSCYRYSDSNLFLPFYKAIKYSDIIFIFLVFNLVLFLDTNWSLSYKLCKKRKIKKERKELLLKDNKKNMPPLNTDNGYNEILYDEPWENGDKDFLDRQTLRKQIFNVILNINHNNSFTIGICSEWGNGKTSLLKMINNDLKDKPDIITFFFNPWRSSRFENIIPDFFTSLKKETAKYSSELLPAINKYLKFFTPIDKTNISKALVDILGEITSTEKEYDKLNKALQNIGKKIVVFIDDLDRLDKKEVIEVLRLIRNIANLKKLIFVVAYDKEYIIQALKDLTEYKPKKYIEKIFQYEIQLSKPSHNQIRIFIEEQFKIYFKENWKEENFQLKEELCSIYNIRDAKRIYNSIIQSLKGKINHIYFDDFFCLELIKQSNYNLYSELSRRKLLKINIEWPGTYMLDFKNSSEWLDKNSIEFLIIKHLFNNVNRDRFCIKQIQSIENYFNDNPLGYSRLTFKSLLSSKEIDKEITEIKRLKEDDQLLYDLKNYDINQFEKQEEFENYLKITELLSSQYGELCYLLPQKLGEKYSIGRLFKDKNEYKIFIECKIWESSLRYFSSYLRAIIHLYQDNKDFKFILSQNECQTLVVKRLKEFKEVNENAMWVFYGCVDRINNNHKIQTLPKANEFMRKLIEDNPKYYLENLIRPGMIPHMNRYFVIEPFYEQIFGSKEGFQDFLAKMTPDKSKLDQDFLDELKEFYKEYYQTNPDQDFIFKQSEGTETTKKYPKITEKFKDKY